jgi:AAA domain
VGLSILWQAGAGRHSAGRASRGAPDPLQEREGQRYGRARTANGNEHEGEPEPKTSRLYLVPFGEITLGTERRDLVKGIIPRVGLTVAWGPPKEGKSFTVFDMVMHIALGWPYRGRRVHQGPVVYCAFEGQSGIKARVEAWRQRHLAETTEAVPFYLEPVTINLIREHQDLIAVIKRQLGEAAPVAVVLDTLNRSLHGSESSDEDMSAYVRASDAIREAFQCAVIVVHHCGHGADRPRGHSALIGAADAVIAIRKVKDATGEVVVLEVEMVKDGEAGAVVASRLKGVTVGIDEDGEAITSCVVEPAEFNAGSRPPKVPTLSNIEQIALKALQYAIGEAGVPSPGSDHMPQGSHATVVTVEQWRTYARQRGLSDSEDKKTQAQAFRRAKEGLLAKQRVACWAKWVWPINGKASKASKASNAANEAFEACRTPTTH